MCRGSPGRSVAAGQGGGLGQGGHRAQEQAWRLVGAAQQGRRCGCGWRGAGSASGLRGWPAIDRAGPPASRAARGGGGRRGSPGRADGGVMEQPQPVAGVEPSGDMVPTCRDAPGRRHGRGRAATVVPGQRLAAGGCAGPVGEREGGLRAGVIEPAAAAVGGRAQAALVSAQASMSRPARPHLGHDDGDPGAVRGAAAAALATAARPRRGRCGASASWRLHPGDQARIRRCPPRGSANGSARHHPGSVEAMR